MRRVDNRPKVEKVKCAPPASCRIRSVIGSSSSIANSVSSRSRRAQTCVDVQRMYRQYADGEYMLEVRSRSVRIYCHQMNSAMPREYITVEPQENYSIFYEYKTKLFDSCPPASRAHEYVNDVNSGRTYFRKLRLNISDLRIIENDFEFAESRGQRQALGSAGDCYNRNMNCPQGDFSISVAHTGFTLRPGTVWNTYGNRAVMKLSSDVSVLCPLSASCDAYSFSVPVRSGQLGVATRLLWRLLRTLLHCNNVGTLRERCVIWPCLQRGAAAPSWAD